MGMVVQGAGRYSLGLALLTCAVALIGCRDVIETIPANGHGSQSGSGQQPVEWGAAQDDQLLDLAIQFSVAARSMYAAAGRPGTPHWRIEREIETVDLAVRRVAVAELQHELEVTKRAFTTLLALRDRVQQRDSSSSQIALAAAIGHVESTAEKLVDSGVMDRIHPLYLDRVDEQLISLIWPAGIKDQAPSLAAAFDVANAFLDRLSEVNKDACYELQCGGYGVLAPVVPNARPYIFRPAAQMIAIRPAFRFWLKRMDIANDDRRFIEDAMDAALSAAMLWSEELVTLAAGADEEERLRHKIRHFPTWPRSALYLSRELIARFAEIVNVSRG